MVPKKEGRPRAMNSIMSIWRPQTERCILLLDNDFFGQPKEEWQARVDEIREGRFKVNFNQGINVRLINDEAAQALASMRYYDTRFTRRRLYTAWDNLGQEKIFFQGVDRLEAAGIPPPAPDGLHADRLRAGRDDGTGPPPAPEAGGKGLPRVPDGLRGQQGAEGLPTLGGAPLQRIHTVAGLSQNKPMKGRRESGRRAEAHNERPERRLENSGTGGNGVR